MSTLNVAFGFKAHSGWAALVVIAGPASAYQVLDRRRIELVEAGNAAWGPQPYHAADGLDPDEANAVVERGIEAARRAAAVEINAALKRSRARGHEVTACAVLVPAPMPPWSTAEILAVHFRMHKAEGVLFPDALARAAKSCGLALAAVPEKTLWERAERELRVSRAGLTDTIAALGKTAGPPWGKDQKSATLAAMIALSAGLYRGSQVR